MTKSYSLFQFKLKGPWRFVGDLIDGEFEINVNETKIKILFPTQTLSVFRMPRLGIPKALADFLDQDESAFMNLEEPGEPLYFHTDPPLIHHFELYDLFVLVEKVFRNDEIAFRWAKEFLPSFEQQLSDWIETSTKQIASYQARAYQNPEFGGNVKFWEIGNGDIARPVTHLYSTIVRNLSDEIWGNPVDRDEFQQILRQIEFGNIPSIWQLLMRDARTDFATLNFRKAILQAGLAAESFLLEMLSNQKLELQESKKQLETMTLGELRTMAVKENLLDEALFGRHFVDVRNTAAHKTEAIPESTAKDFLREVELLLIK